jgi:ketosteroid isomerase-like protein
MRDRSTTLATSPITRRKSWVGMAFLAAATVALAAAPSASPQASTIVALAKIRQAWVEDLRSKKLEPILKFNAPDAVFLQPSGQRITGSAALRTLFQNIMATFDSDLTLHSQNLETSGDLAYDSGDFEETLTTITTGAKITSKGSYIIIYRHPPSGDWLIVQHAWTGSPPPGA